MGLLEIIFPFLKKKEKKGEIKNLRDDETEKLIKKLKKSSAPIYEDKGNPKVLLDNLLSVLEKNDYKTFLKTFIFYMNNPMYQNLTQKLFRNFPAHFEVDLEYIKRGDKAFNDYLKKYSKPELLFEEIERIKKLKERKD